MSAFVTRTPLSNLRPLGTDAERSFERIIAVVTQHTSAAHAAMLAEPVPARDGSAIDWYAESDSEIRPLASLTPEEQVAVRTTLESQVGDILAAAEAAEGKPAQKAVASALRNAMIFPEQNSLWAMRSGTEWLPLIVGWSHTEHDTVTPRPFQVTALGQKRSVSGTRHATAAPHTILNAAGPIPIEGTTATAAGAASVAGTSSGLVVTERRRGLLERLWPLLLLLAALILALLIAAFLLPACGLKTPFGTIAFGLPAPACEVGVGDDLAVASSRADDLQRELKSLEEQYRRERLQCLIPDEPVLMPVPEEPTLQSQLMEEAPVGAPPEEARVQDRGTVQVTLEWDTRDDLDLQVVCPNGERISFSRKVGCGGVLDIDANYPSSAAIAEPAENITFEQGPSMPGQYGVRVTRYGSQGGPPVPFRVKVRQGEDETFYSGAAGRSDPVSIADFFVPPSAP